MAKDDYFVLVYKLLRYLYRCLKENTSVSWDIVAPNTKDFPIGQEYFTYLLSHLLADGYIEGIAAIKQIGASTQFKETTGLAITPKGIAYLEENSAMKRAGDFLGPAGEIANAVISKFV
jgi:hypothetical protein